MFKPEFIDKITYNCPEQYVGTVIKLCTEAEQIGYDRAIKTVTKLFAVALNTSAEELEKKINQL